MAQCSDDVSGPVAHTPAIGPAGLPRTARVAAKREEIGFGINSSVSVRWGKATAAAWLDAIVVAFEPEGPRPVHVCFEIDDNYAWVPMVHVKPHADAEPSSVPEGLQVGCLIEVQDPHCKLDPDQWHSGKVENVKQTAAGAVQTGLLFWVQFMGDRTNQWCRLRHVRPQPTVTPKAVDPKSCLNDAAPSAAGRRCGSCTAGSRVEILSGSNWWPATITSAEFHGVNVNYDTGHHESGITDPSRIRRLESVGTLLLEPSNARTCSGSGRTDLNIQKPPRYRCTLLPL